MLAILQPVITLIEESLLPLLTSSANVSLITNIINVLVGVVPSLIGEAQVLVQPVKNIIAALSANPATTADQLVTLQSLDAATDAAFDQAGADLGLTDAPSATN